MSAGEALVRAGLSGAWQLVSCVMTHADGRIEHPFGPEPRGLIAYTADGWMACQMAGEPAGHSAYFGPVSVNEDGATIIHHVQGASHPRLSGDQVRGYRVKGDQLLLSAETGGSLVEVLWRRP
ncbi:lipocalin-like domain-containing protein [Novosphingobium sp.]|uniref:lipocalin-like domain-containing protein n=1 Tax=Novosphingobium sp. TaxID=1874826 RepID=UPI0026039D01|nr:lipocalin-like domain-containing protein [Novosphingobium sp.]